MAFECHLQIFENDELELEVKNFIPYLCRLHLWI